MTTTNPLVPSNSLGALIQTQSAPPPSGPSTSQDAFLMPQNPVTTTPSTAPEGTVQAPAVISSNAATQTANNIQNNMNSRMASAASIANARQNMTTTYDAQGNMIKTGGIMDNGNRYMEMYSRGSAGYVANPVEVKSLQDQLAEKQRQLREQQSTEALTNAISGANSTATGTPTTPSTTNPSSVTPPQGIDVDTSEGQYQWYHQDPESFDTWAKDQGWTTSDVANLHYQAAVNQEQLDMDSIKLDLDKFKNGTYPLTAAQQSMLDAVRAQFERVIETQKLTNQSYENGTRILGYTSGRAEYAPYDAIGQVKAAVDSGLQKISDLHAKENETLATMELGFQTNNFKMVTDANNQLLAIDKRITENFKNIHDDIVAANKDARDYNYKVAQDNIKNILDQKNFDLNSDKFTWQKKIDDIELQLKKSGLDEERRHNLATEAQARVLQSMSNPANMPQVNMTSSGLPDRAGQATFLAQFPQDLQTTIKQIAEYRQNPNSITTRQYQGVGTPNRQQILSWVAQYDPTYSEAQYGARQSLVNNFASGKYSQNVTSLNTAIGHVHDLVDNFAILNNTGFTPYNQAKNEINKIFGRSGLAGAETNFIAAADELATIFKGTAGTDQQVDAWRNSLGHGGILRASPAQVRDFVTTASNLLDSRLEALNGTYTMGMGKPKEGGFLNDSSQQKLLDLKSKGYDIRVSALADSPYVRIQAFHDSGADNARILEQIKQLAPNASAQEVVDTLAQYGISL